MKDHPLKKYQAQIEKIAKDRGISYLGLFGSYARGEQTKTSDIDLLVCFSRRLSLLDLVNTERKISETVGAPVDLIPEDSLNKYVRPYAMRDLITLYGQR